MRLRSATIGAVLAAALLTGCSLGESGAPEPGFEVQGVPNPAAMPDKILDTFKSAKLTGHPQLSGVRRAPVTAPADWMICLRADVPSDPRVYAVFLRPGQVVDYRLALAVDQCAGESYAPLPTPMAVK